MKLTMGRPRHNPTARKEKVSVSIDPDLLAWVIERSGQGREFSGISHAFERGIVCLQERSDPAGKVR